VIAPGRGAGDALGLEVPLLERGKGAREAYSLHASALEDQVREWLLLFGHGASRLLPRL